MHFALSEKDQPSCKEGDAGGCSFDQSDGIDSDLLTRKYGYMSDLDREDRDRCCRQADENMGSKPGRPIAPFALESDCRSENRRKQKSRSYHSKG